MFDPFSLLHIHSYSRLLPERLGALFRDPVIGVLVLLLIGLGYREFITSSLKALLLDCVLVSPLQPLVTSGISKKSTV